MRNKRKWEQQEGQGSNYTKSTLFTDIFHRLNRVQEIDAPKFKRKRTLIDNGGKWFSYQIEEENNTENIQQANTAPRQDFVKQLSQVQDLATLDHIIEETLKIKAKIQQIPLEESALSTLQQKFPSILSGFTRVETSNHVDQHTTSRNLISRSEMKLYLPQSIVTYIAKFLPIFDWIRASHVCKLWYHSLWFTKGSISNFVLNDPNSSWQSNFTFYLFFKQYEFCNEIHSMRALPPKGTSRDEEDDSTFEVFTWKSSSLPLFKGAYFKDGVLEPNTNITSIDWCIEVEALFDEYHVSKLKLFYPNLVELELSSRIKLSDCFHLFPNLQKLSLLYIEDQDIQNFKTKHLPLKKLRILENDHMTILHFVCHNFPNLEELIIKDVFDYESSIEFETNTAPLVSKKLTDIAVPAQMKLLKMEGEAFQNGSIYKDFISRFRNLETLFIDCFEGDEEGEENQRLNDEILEVLRNNANISKLEISGLFVTQGLFNTICDTYSSNLSYLNLRLPQRFINEKIRQLSSCKEVKLTHDDDDSTVIRNTTKCLQMLQTSIEKLTLDGSYKLAYSNFCKLRALKLSGKIYSELKIHSDSLQLLDISDASLSLSCELFCKNLEEFYPSSEISSLKIQSNMLVRIGDTNLPYCTKYIITSPLLQTFVLPDIIEVISLQCPLLRRMDLSKEALFSLFDAQNMSISSSKDVQEVVDLNFLEQIKSIRIKSSKFESVSQLCQTLSKFSNLEEILFDECEFFEPMLKYYAEEFTALHSMRTLNNATEVPHPTEYMISKIEKWLQDELMPLQSVITSQFSRVQSLRFHRVYRFHFPMRLFCHLFPHLHSLSIDNWTLETMHNVDRVSLETCNFWTKLNEEMEDKRWKELNEFIFDDTGPGMLMDVEMVQHLVDYLLCENPMKKLILMLPFRTFTSLPKPREVNSTAVPLESNTTTTTVPANREEATQITTTGFDPVDMTQNALRNIPEYIHQNREASEVFNMLHEFFSRTTSETYSLKLKSCATLQKLETNVNIVEMSVLPTLDHFLVTNICGLHRIASEEDLKTILQLVKPNCPELKYFHLCSKFYPIANQVSEQPTQHHLSMKESMLKYVTLIKEFIPQVEYMSTYVSDQSTDCTILSFELRLIAPNLEMNIKPKFKYNSEIRNRYGRMRVHHQLQGFEEDEDDFSDDEQQFDMPNFDDDDDLDSSLSDSSGMSDGDFDDEDEDEDDNVIVVDDEDEDENGVILISDDDDDDFEEDE